MENDHAADDASEEGEGPTLSELERDINAVLARMEEMQDDDPDDARMEPTVKSFRQLSELCREDPDMVPPAGLVDYIRESVSMWEDYDTCGPPGSDGEADFIGRVAAATASDRYLTREDMDLTIQEGNIAMIHSLQSAAGKRLNGRRVLVLRYHRDQERWECRVECEKGGPAATKALREANLTPVKRIPLPDGPNRGNADMFMLGDLERMPPKLCELLLNHQREGFEPSRIVFGGYAGHMFARMGEENFMMLAATQMEQYGAVLGLGNFCDQAGEEGTESVVIALLEGDEMYVDTLLQTIYWTGEIIRSSWDSDYYGREGFRNDCPPTQLTPDQDTPPYIRLMKEGPLLILGCAAEYCFAPALWAAMSHSMYYHLLVQRLLRWIAREAMETRDGLALGATVRKILSSMFPDVACTLKQPISARAAETIMRDSASVFSDPSSVTVENVRNLMGNSQDVDMLSLD